MMGVQKPLPPDIWFMYVALFDGTIDHVVVRYKHFALAKFKTEALATRYRNWVWSRRRWRDTIEARYRDGKPDLSKLLGTW